MSASADELAAAQIIADELARRNARVTIDRERVHGTYWVPIGLACVIAAGARRIGRRAAVVAGLLATLSVSDDLETGRRPLRRVLPQHMTANVIGELGPADAERTLIIHAHHDAARTGIVFHPAIAKLTARVAGGAIERFEGTPAPMWGAAAGPALVALGAASGRRRLPDRRHLSMAWYKAPANYHWPSDRPENLDFGSIADAGTLALRLVRHLDAAQPPP